MSTSPTTETQTKPEGNGAPPPTPEPKGSTGAPPENGEHMIPKGRFDEVIAKRNELQAKLDAREESDRKAAEKKAIADGEYQKVIDTQSAEIAALKATAARFDALVATLEPQIDAESKDWPEEVKAMLAMGKTIEEKFAILPNARTLAAKLANGGNPPPPGTGDKPKPKGGSNTADAQQLANQHVRAQRSYGF